MGQATIRRNAVFAKRVDGDPELAQAEGAVHWWIGDWLAYGEQQPYGEKYKEALEATGFKYNTLVNDKALAGQFEIPRRRGNLDWGYHAAVGGMPPDEQDRWLDLTEEHGWKLAELRRQIRKAQPRPPIPAGKFRVIYADPPWSYGDQLVDGYGPSQAADLPGRGHYNAMAIGELWRPGPGWRS